MLVYPLKVKRSLANTEPLGNSTYGLFDPLLTRVFCFMNEAEAKLLLRKPWVLKL